MKRTAFYISDNETIKWEHNEKAYCLHIQRDRYPDNPRSWEDNDARLTTMACWHRRYNLGDVDATKGLSPEDFWQNLVDKNVSDAEVIEAAMSGRLDGIRVITKDEDGDAATVFCLFNDGEESEDVISRSELAQFIRDDLSLKNCQILMAPHAAWMPIWMYDHSGITISCGSRTGQYADRWDSGQLGIIIMLKEKAMKELVEYVLDEKGERILEGDRGFKTRPLNEDTWRARAIEVMKGEIETYDQYLTGDVYSFTLYEADPVDEGETPDWEESDSCGSFYGDDIFTNGMMDHIGLGLREAVTSGAYKQGEAVLHTTTWYEF